MRLIKLPFLLVVVFLLLLQSIHSSSASIRKMTLRLSSGYVYYATLAFGTRNQNLELLVDTGSQNLAIFCDLCTNNCNPEQ